MPTFHTPEPITVAIELAVADVRLTAGDRDHTTVEVRPRNPEDRNDVTAAEQTRVEYEAGRLLVKSTHRWRSLSPFSDGGGIEVEIELPASSRVRAQTAVGALRFEGRLVEAYVKSGLGEVQVADAVQASIVTGAGDVLVERVPGSGQLELSTGSGEVRLGDVEGTATVKNSNGQTHVRRLGGTLSVRAANGDITVEHCEGELTAKTANGDVRVSAVGGGSVKAESGCGAVEIGILAGTAAWLDLHTGYGRLDNRLDVAESPQAREQRAEVRAHTGFGDVTIYRRLGEAAAAPAV